MTDESQFIAYLAGPILAMESNSLRFEKFVCEIVGQLEGGITVFPTSRSWDLGKDGRGLRQALEVSVAAGLEPALSAKCAADIERMCPYLPGNSKVYFCTPQKLSEHAKIAIEKEMKALLPDGCGLLVLAKQQLDFAIERHPIVFFKYYGAEYQDAVNTLSIGQSNYGDRAGALRLVLSVSSVGDSSAIRNELYETLVLDSLSSESKTVNRIALGVSGILGLGRSLPVDTLLTILNQCVQKGVAEVDASGLYGLTEQGKAANGFRLETASEQLIEGRTQFRLALEKETGQSLLDSHYEAIWSEVKTGISLAFYDRGSEMVELLSSIVERKDSPGGSNNSGNPTLGVDEEVEPFIREMAARIAGTTSNEAQAEELRVAVRDIFSNPGTEIAEWLSGLCAKFVMLCSLGVEHKFGKAIAESLGKIQLILDTDVVLSLLCEGEAQHDAIKAIVERWPLLGGRIFVAEPVFSEVAHHAWIAEHDFNQCGTWLAAPKEDRVRYVENAFVRAFAEIVSRKKAKVRDWAGYIAQYKGSSPQDSSRVLAVLTRDMKGVYSLPRMSESEAYLRADVEKFLVESAFGDTTRLAKIANDKAKRDSILYASMVSFLRLEREKDADANCILVSSARRLLLVEKRFGRAGEDHLVLSAGAVIYLLSLVPGVSIALSAMESFLFDSRGVRFASELERRVMRMVAESREYRPLGFARRSALVRDVKNRLLEVADRSSGSDDPATAMVRRANFNLDSAELVTSAVKGALDKLAIDTKTEVELRETRRRLREAEERIETLMAERRNGFTQKKKPYRPPRKKR